METEQNEKHAPTISEFSAEVIRVVHLIESGQETATNVIEHIVTDFSNKVTELYRNIQDAERAVDAYAAMDRAQQEVLKYVRATVGQLAQANAAHIAQNDFLRMTRNKVLDLAYKAVDDGCTSFTSEMLAEASGVGQAGEPRDERPVAVGLSVDSRFKWGQFAYGPDDQARARLPFVGWTMVVNSRLTHSRLEPTFWYGAAGHAVTQSELLLQNMKLLQLT